MKWAGLIFIALLVIAFVDGKKGSKATTTSRLQTKKVASKGKRTSDRGSWEEDIDLADAEPAAVEGAPKETQRFKATKTPAAEDLPADDGPDGDSVYQVLARHIVNYAVDDVTRRAPLDEVERAIRVMASAQAAWKSVDGATHQLKNTIKARYDRESEAFLCVVNSLISMCLRSSTSLSSRYKRFIARRSKNTKEAAKLNEYVDVVERGLQGAEILQPILREASNKRRRERFLREAGLVEVDRFVVMSPSNPRLSVLVTVLVPQASARDESASDGSPRRFESSEVVIAVADDPARPTEQLVAELLRIASTETPVTVPLASSTTGAEEAAKSVSVLPSLMELAEMIQTRLKPRLVLKPPADAGDAADAEDNDSISSRCAFDHVRLVGHSAGGSVASYLSMLLDGFLQPSEGVTAGDSRPYRGRVRCITYGAMPCISRSVIPSFVTSLICGDDLVCRLQHDSVERMRQKVSAAVAGGAGKRGLGWLSGASLLGELSHTASKQISQYQSRKKDNKGLLQLPGRVFYMKSRQLKQGATLQRVLRGNWQEEVMWSIRDVLVSPKMLQHHALEAYIRTLSRC